jgi:hypothetical protein
MQARETTTLLPDGRFSGQITQNRPEKNISGRKKLVAVRPPILLKSSRKQAGKNYFISSISDIFGPQTCRVLQTSVPLQRNRG